MPQTINPAQRVAEIPEYYFSRKLREVAALRAAGRPIISLAIGGPDLPPHPNVIEKLQTTASRPDAHSYQLTRGTAALRDAYAKWYQRIYGINLKPDSEIQPLIGSKEGILYISLAFLNPGDRVLVPDPGYITYRSASRLAGATPVAYNLLECNGWLPDFAELERLAEEHSPKLMWVNYPHMPTGTPPPEGLFQRLVDFAKDHGIVIVNDNPYSQILNPQPSSILAAEGARQIAIELNSLSKSHNMAGWRMAMAASNPEFIEWIVKMKSNVDSGQFLPMMEAATEAVALGPEWNQSLNDTYRSRQEIAHRIMDSLGCITAPDQCGLFLWGHIPESWESSEAYADHILERYNIFLTPGSIFGENGKRYIRLSLCAPATVLTEALSRLKQQTL